MVDVVGLRFVTDGQMEALKALQDYKNGLLTVSQLQNKHVATMNSALAREAQAQKKAAQDIANAQRRRDSEDRASLQRYLRYQREKEAAAQREARVIEQAAQEAVRAQQRQAQETEALARAYNPLMAATAAYEREVVQLTRAEQLGVLTKEQLDAKLAQLSTAYMQAGTSVANATRFMNQYGQGVNVAGMRTNKFGMYAQQVGYQVGDFFVQMQTGTNVFVAFGQQATQLAGLLPGVLGAVLGIGISVSTMFLSMWSRTRAATNEAAMALDAYGEAVKSVDGDIRSLTSELYALARGFDGATQGSILQQIDAMTAEIIANEQRMAALRAGEGGGDPRSRRSEAEALVEVNERLKETIASDTERLRLIREQTEARRVLESAVDTVERFEQERSLLGAQIRLMESGVEVSAARQAAEDGVLLAMVAQAAAAEDLTPEVRAQLEAFGHTLQAVRDAEARTRELAAAAEDAAGGAAAIPGGFYGAVAAVDTMNARLDTTLGKIGSILSAIGQIGFDIVAAQAETAALNAGMSAGAARIEGEYAAAIAGGAQTGLAGLANTLQAGVMRVAAQARLEAEEARQTAAAAQIASTAGGSSPGGGSVEDTTQSIEQLTEAYNRLMGQLDPTIEAAQKLARDTKILTDAYAAGVISTEELATAQEMLRESMEGDGEDNWLVKPLEDFGAALGDLIESGGKDFDTFTKRMVSSLSQAVAKMVAEMAGARLGQALGRFAGPVGSIIGSVVGSFAGNALGKLFNTDGTPRQDARDAQALQLQAAILEAEGKTNQIRRMVLDKMWSGNHALQKKLWLLEDEKRINDEKLGLQQQLWQLTGQTNKLRKLELSTLDKSNRELQKRIWMIEDRRAARALGEDAGGGRDGAPRDNSERLGLMRRIWELTGQSAKIRRAELLALEPANRALQRRIWALEKEAEAAAKAKAEMEAVRSDRLSLRREWYELIGDEQTLRKMDLKLLDESLHPLQMRIWALEDEREAAEAAAAAAERLADSLTTDQFRSAFAFNRAVGLARYGNLTPSTSPAVPSTAGSTAATVAGATGGGGGTTTVKTSEALLAALLHRMTSMEKTVRKWDRNGLPEERAQS